MTSESANDTGHVRAALVVVTYNSVQHMVSLGELRSSLEKHWAVVVVDNDSTDRTVSTARRLGMEVVRTGGNLGYGAACNAGAAAIQSGVYVFANPDVRTTPADLERLLSALESARHTGSNIGMVGPVFGEPPWTNLRFASVPRDIYGFGPKALRPLLSAVSRGQWSDTVDVDSRLALAPVDFTVGALFACRAELLDSVGGFDERFFLYSEEEDLAKRARARGWVAGVLPAARAQHEETSSSAGEDSRSMAEVRISGKLLYYRIHRGRAYAGVARAVISVLLAAHGVGALIRGRDPIYPWSLPWTVATRRTEPRQRPR